MYQIMYINYRSCKNKRIDEKVEGKRKRMQSSVAEKPKRKRIIIHSKSSEDENTSSSEMDTDSGSEEVFESNGPRFRVRGSRNKKAIVEFKNMKSHSECKFDENNFDVLHADMSRAEILKIATTTPECLDCLEYR